MKISDSAKRKNPFEMNIFQSNTYFKSSYSKKCILFEEDMVILASNLQKFLKNPLLQFVGPI